jgi:signal transduction histidine kinase
MAQNLDKLNHEQLLLYARDLRNLQQAEKERTCELESANRKLRATIDCISHALITVNKEHIIVDANQHFTRLAGKPFREIIMHPVAECLAGPEWEKLISAIRGSNGPQQFDLSLESSRHHIYRVEVSPILNDKNDFDGMVITFQDESEILRTTRLKEEFLGLISHEIRTPLTGITGFAELLRLNLEEHLTEEDIEVFEYLKNATKRLIRTVEELIDAAKLQDSISEERTPVDLHSLIDGIIRSSNETAAERKLKIEFQHYGLHFTTLGYRGLLSRAVQHLHENAMEFSYPDSKINIRLIEGADQYQVEVQDYGQGMEQSEIDKIFAPFYQSEFYQKRNHEGLGLGLAIVRRTAILHKGTIKMISKQGEGSRAIFSLPKTIREAQPDDDNETINVLKKDLIELQEQTKNYASDLAATFAANKNLQNQLSKTRKQLIRSEKLAMMGRMGASVAHEMINSLVPIIGYAEMINRFETNLPETVGKNIQKIESRARVTSDSLRKFLNYSRSDDSHYEVIDLIDRIENALDLVKYRTKTANVTINKYYQVKHATIQGAGGQWEQVFTNLFINAMDAMNNDGFISISVAQKRNSLPNSNSFFEIIVSDNGPGIAREIQETIFEPFFTTKAEGHGTGLGLYIIHQIIDRHNGTIDVESHPGSGTAFIIRVQESN